MVEETGKPTSDRRPLCCHMHRPGFDPGSQQVQATVLSTVLSRHLDQKTQVGCLSLQHLWGQRKHIGTGYMHVANYATV